MSPSHQFEPATIINTTTGDAVPVMYNPDEIKLEQGNTFAEIGIPGLNASPVQYVRGKSRALTMELFFDTYETGQDVRTRTAQIVALLDKSPQTHAPPVLVFAMGGFAFRCVLVDAAQRFTMFLPDGTPVRSYLSVRLQEFVAVSVDIERGLFLGSPTASAAVNTAAEIGRAVVSGDATVHLTTEGETLEGLAGALLGDPARWRDIADANSVEDPFDLPVGTRLVIPARKA